MYRPDPQANVLLVDDDARNLVALQAQLEGVGHLVRVTSGAEALRQFAAQEFAVVVLDAQMPIMDGFETARQLRAREQGRHTPVIFLTAAYEDAQSMLRGYLTGAVDYLVKPVDAAVLRSKVELFVELHRRTTALAHEIGQRRKVEENLGASQASLRALAARLQAAREEEQLLIAREFHDELGQFLTGLKIDLGWLAAGLSPEQKALVNRTHAIAAAVDSAVHAVRRIAARLRPPALDQVGLATAIKWRTQEFQRRTGVRCKVSLSKESDSLGGERATALYRIFQELLAEVERGADPTRVDVALSSGEAGDVLEVSDNGKRGPEDRGSLVLLEMRERALSFGGKLEVSAGPAGTRVTVSLPRL